VSGSLSVGALAVKSAEGNAIGAVRLTLLRDKIELELLKVGAFHESFVPGALTESVRFEAPYSAIRGLVRRGEALVLTLDPRSPTPYTRFVLTHFTDLPLEALAAAHKQRARAIFVRGALPVPSGAAAALLVPDDLASGAIGRGAVGLVAFVAAFALCSAWVRVRSWGGPLAERLRDAVEKRIAAKLAIAPRDAFLAEDVTVITGDGPRGHEIPHVVPNVALRAPVRAAPAPSSVDAKPLDAPAKEALVARAPSPLGRVAAERTRIQAYALAAFAAVAVLGALALYRKIDRAPATSPATTAAATEAAPVETTPEVIAPPPPSCSCVRADSPLWASPMPALTTILTSRQKDESGRPIGVIAPAMGKKGSGHYDFELGIVNDAATAMRDIRVVITFARRNKKNERVGATDRGFFWAGELAPAQSVKWNVSAPGTEYRIDLDEKRVLGDGAGMVAPAPADAFVRLLAAKQPVVRLHAALMLAYLHDPRARDAVDNVGELSDSDERIREMIARASAPIIVCNAKYADDSLTACIANDGEAAADRIDLVEVGPEGRRFPIADSVPPHAGIVARVPGFGSPAEELTVKRR
jgi:hypothetical protein